MKTAPEKTVNKLSIEDLQYVAREVLERELTSEEIAAVENALGDYIDWFQAIENAIYHCISDRDRVTKLIQG